MVVANPHCTGTVSEFIRLARARDWESLSRYQHFDALSNVALVSALRCPEGELTVLYVRDPFELYENKSLEGWDALSEVDAREWTLFLTQSKWINL
jgi:hypothetical protein